MPPKKADAKTAGDPDAAEKEENLKKLESKKQTLEYEVMMQNALLETCQTSEDKYNQRIAQLDKLFKEEHEKQRDVAGEMSRQYREMQESFDALFAEWNILIESWNFWKLYVD